MFLASAFIIILLFPAQGIASHLFKEKDYQNIWCKGQGGITEYILDDRTRVDCLTDEYAVEVDHANKWYEAIGQALYYSIKTDRKPGILLIIESDKDLRYLKRLNTVSEKYQIKIWLIRPEDIYNFISK